MLDDPPASLSVIIPVHNGMGWIGRCIDHVGTAIRSAAIEDAEIVVVDDGSSDGTVAEVRTYRDGHPDLSISITSQTNGGRFRARLTGLEAARHDFVLFIDTRVFLDEGSLRFVVPQLADPATQVWTAHVEADTVHSPIGGFWQAIEHVAWRRYFRSPRQLSFGIDDFDYYPKGTTALLGPRRLFLEAFERYEPTVDDWHISNDDTAVLRWVAQSWPINIAPSYRATYHSRTTLPAFVRHARHRGAVLIDGYLRPGARFSRAIVVVLALTPIGMIVLARRPALIAPAALAVSVAAGVGVRAGGARRFDSVVVGALAVPFGVSYVAGMWRGVAARLRSVRRTVRPGVVG